MEIMKPATKVAAVCIGIIACGAIICFCILGYFHLEKVVLIAGQTEFSLAPQDEESAEDPEEPDQMGMNFFFLTNAADSRSISEVSFAEAPDIHLWPGYQNESDGEFDDECGPGTVSPGDRMGLYRGGWVDLLFDAESIEFLETMSTSFTAGNATICFENGEKESVSIDPITFHPPGGNAYYRDEDPPGTFKQAVAFLKERGWL